MAYILIAERGENDRPNGLYRVLHPTTFEVLATGLPLAEAETWPPREAEE